MKMLVVSHGAMKFGSKLEVLFWLVGCSYVKYLYILSSIGLITFPNLSFIKIFQNCYKVEGLIHNI